MITEFKFKYAFLSNFYYSTFILDGKTYHSVEHYFQAHKTINSDDFQKIILAESPKEAKDMGRKVKLRSDWDQVKDNVMFNGVFAKFDQNETLKEKLILTEDEYLQEGNYWGDTYWGVDLRTGKGLNKLGKLLMRCRECFIVNFRKETFM